MQKLKILLVIVLSGMIAMSSFIGISLDADASVRVLPTIKSFTVNSYSEFYKAFNDCIVKKANSIVVNVNGYNSNVYNENTIINTVMKKNPNLAYIVSSKNFIKQKKGSVTTLKGSFTYMDCEYVAPNLKAFFSSIANAMKAKKTNIKIKINDYSKGYSMNAYNQYLSKAGIASGFVFGKATIYRVENLKSVAYVISPSNITKSNTTEKETRGSSNGSVANSDKKTEDSALPVFSNMTEISNYVKKALQNSESQAEFKVSSVKLLSFEKINRIVDETIDENLEYCYFNSWNKSFSTLGEIGTYKVVFKLFYPKDKVQAMAKLLDTKINNILASVVRNGMSDYEKELAIHDYIVNNTKYDYDNYLRNTIPDDSFLAYGVLVKGVAVCSGYTKAFKRLMNAAGIECRIINGATQGSFTGAHAWNLVKLENEFYHVDTTFDDPISQGSDKNLIRHTYFNLSDKEISKDHTWDKSKYPSCSSNNFGFLKVGI